MKLVNTVIVILLLSFSSFLLAQINIPTHLEFQTKNDIGKELMLENFDEVFSVELSHFQNLSIENPSPQELTILTQNEKHTIQLDPFIYLNSQNIYLWNGRTNESRFEHLPHYRDVVVTYNPTTKKFVGSFIFPEGEFLLLPTKETNENYWFVKSTSELDCTLLDANSDLYPKTVSTRSPDCDCTEVDQNGDYPIDIFMGYSDLAAVVAGDINAHAAMMVATVNQGLTNSLVTDVYMRLVGTGTTTNNPGIITSVLTDCLTWFATEIDNTGADYVAVFQTPTGAAGEAGGWAGVGGFTSVNSINGPTVFRHEIGHNAGGGHCPGDGSVLPIAHGFDNGNWRTHLCGNDVNFYSTPLVNDNNGNPIGDAATADMAETFRVRASAITGRLRHQIPYYVGDTCVDLHCKPSHFANQNEFITKVEINTISNISGGWQCSNVTGYSDYIDQSTTLNLGTTYPITVTPNFSFSNSKLNVWVDWNEDNEFQSSEHVINLTGNGPWTSNITPPASATVGEKRLRVRMQFGASYVPDPCNGSGYNGGETEDYTINVSSSALPVELANFEAQCTDDGLVLNWQTFSETNNLGFEIEGSIDGINWERVGWHPAFGNGNSLETQQYNYELPFSATSFYRLRQLDQDLAFEFSPVISKVCTSSNTGNPFFIYPTPTKNSITIETDEVLELPSNFKLFNQAGILIREFECTNTQTIQSVSDIANGIYFYRMTNRNGLYQQGEIVKVD